MYMGLTLINRILVFFKKYDKYININVTNSQTIYIDFIYKQITQITGYLKYELSNNKSELLNGYYVHGFNWIDKHYSCCSWLRANAWILLIKLYSNNKYV